MNMKKKDAESELEFLETSSEARAEGLRRIKRRHFDGPPELLPKEDQVNVEVTLDAEVATFFQNDPKRISKILRSAMEKEKVARELLEDEAFIKGLKAKLAA